MNEITIRFWAKEKDNAGHISLQTFRGGENNNGIYASFWPKATVNSWYNSPSSLFRRSQPSYCSQQKHVMSHHHTLADDLTAEQRQPELEITLTCLDVDAINEAYEAIVKDASLRWTLLGGSNFFGGANTATCSSLCARLLMAGGINDLFVQPVDKLSLANYRFHRALRASARQASFGTNDIFFYANSYEFGVQPGKEYFGTNFVGLVSNPKPIDVINFVVKAFKIERQLIQCVEPCEIIVNANNQFEVNPNYAIDEGSPTKQVEDKYLAIKRLLPQFSFGIFAPLFFSQREVIDHHADALNNGNVELSERINFAQRIIFFGALKKRLLHFARNYISPTNYLETHITTKANFISYRVGDLQTLHRYLAKITELFSPITDQASFSRQLYDLDKILNIQPHDDELVDLMQYEEYMNKNPFSTVRGLRRVQPV